MGVVYIAFVIILMYIHVTLVNIVNQVYVYNIFLGEQTVWERENPNIIKRDCLRITGINHLPAVKR